MEIGRIICQIRKSKGMTQEQLANSVGVSIPAVSKWETGNSLPDIKLLAPIARTLETTIDNLLCYNEFITEEKANELLLKIESTCKTNGFREGMRYALSIIREYPNSDYLKLKIIMCSITLTYTLDSDYTEKEYVQLFDETTKLLEDLIYSENIEIGGAAKVNLATRYMENERYEEAELLLNQLPNIDYNARRILPPLYSMQKNYTKALQLGEENLLQDINNIGTSLLTLHKIMLSKKEYKQALLFAHNYYDLSKIYGSCQISGAELFITIYLESKEINKALKWFEIYVNDIINLDMDYSKLPYFSHISSDIILSFTNAQENIKLALYKAILLNPKYEPLKHEPVYKNALNKLEAFIKHK